MTGAIGLPVLGFGALLVGAYLFTNAVEWAGVRLDLGHGALGSVVAAVATALPESPRWGGRLRPSHLGVRLMLSVGAVGSILIGR